MIRLLSKNWHVVFLFGTFPHRWKFSFGASQGEADRCLALSRVVIPDDMGMQHVGQRRCSKKYRGPKRRSWPHFGMCQVSS